MISSLLSLNLGVLVHFLAFEEKKYIKECWKKVTKMLEKASKTLKKQQQQQQQQPDKNKTTKEK